jgi:flagellar FliL protein
LPASVSFGRTRPVVTIKLPDDARFSEKSLYHIRELGSRSMGAKMATTRTMDGDDAEVGPTDGATAKPEKGGRKKLIIIALAFLLALGGASGAAYAFGLLGKLTGGGKELPATVVPGGIDLPEMVANLNAGNRRTAFVRIKARLELADRTDEITVKTASPRIQDLFQTYLRDMRPEELRGSAGMYRLREELLARVNIALAPARATDILFVELLVQ